MSHCWLIHSDTATFSCWCVIHKKKLLWFLRCYSNKVEFSVCNLFYVHLLCRCLGFHCSIWIKTLQGTNRLKVSFATTIFSLLWADIAILRESLPRTSQLNCMHLGHWMFGRIIVIQFGRVIFWAATFGRVWGLLLHQQCRLTNPGNILRLTRMIDVYLCCLLIHILLTMYKLT